MLRLLLMCGQILSTASIVLAEEPATLLFAEQFDDPALHERSWYDGRRFVISDQVPFSGTGCIEYHWPAEATTPRTSAVRRLFEPTESIYVRFRMRLSENWGWSGRAYHPHLMNILTTENDKYAGPAATHLTLYIEPQNGRLRLAAQDIQNKDQPHGLTQGPLQGGYNGKFYDSEQVLFDDAEWHLVEAEFRLNTLDVTADAPRRDGIIRGWFDGELVIEHKNVVLRTTDFPQMRFNQFLLAPYFGPGLLPHEQQLWIDQLEVHNRRPPEET